MYKVYDTIIIGGGVLGSSIAYYLSESQKEDIAVIEKEYPLAGASGANQGLIWVQTKSPAWYCEVSYYSAELYKYLNRKIGDIEYRRTGGIVPLFTEEEKEHAQKSVEERCELGITTQILSRKEALALEPALSPDILGATYCEADGNVNPFRLVNQYMQKAKEQGVVYETNQEVLNIEAQNQGYIIYTPNETYYCKKLVLSAGLGLTKLGRMLGITVPIHPEQGQMLVTEAIPPLIHHTFAGIRQAYNGELLIGNTHSLTNVCTNTDLDVASQIAQFAIKCIPALSKIKIVRNFAGIRVMTDDGLPIMGEIEGFQNLYIAVMHSGITLAPLVGTLMAQLITRQETELLLERFNISRFC
jgi:glycine/D-amino acid oxidase-like deaminating enzyme